ncbi:MAG: glycosyltransferase family 2 protein [Eubacteriales bacterium]
MKTISVLIPCYNEEENIEPLAQSIIEVFKNDIPYHNYNITFIDNFSTDKSRVILEKICSKNAQIRAIFNVKNFGHIRSPYYGLLNSTGDCTIVMACDFQDPPEKIVELVAKWDEGFKIVIAKKTKSCENPIMYFLRSKYYKVLKKVSDVEQIEHFTGFGLYDAEFIEMLKDLNEPYPYLRGIIAELGYQRADIEFEQPKRKAGKTKNNFYTLFDMGMLGITSYSKVVMRLSTILGFVVAGFSFLVALVYLIMKIIYWDKFPIGTAPIIISIFFFGAVQLFFTGIMGEYILNINTRITNRPLVIEEKRINFK